MRVTRWFGLSRVRAPICIRPRSREREKRASLPFAKFARRSGLAGYHPRSVGCGDLTQRLTGTASVTETFAPPVRCGWFHGRVFGAHRVARSCASLHANGHILGRRMPGHGHQSDEREGGQAETADDIELAVASWPR